MQAKIPLKKMYLYGNIVFFLLIVPYLILLFQSPEQRINFTKEDGIIENLSAIFFFMASCICFYLFFKSISDDKVYFLKIRRNCFFLILGLLFIFCFGEEISWGQRFFCINTSDYLMKINNQGETNLHNLYFFQRYIKNSPVIGWFMTPERIFVLIWLFYCLLIPICNKFSLKVRNFIRKIYFPIIPIWLGILFPLNQLISEIFEKMQILLGLQAIIEIKETNFAFLFFLASISLYIKYKNNPGQVDII
jgi:hypothetical protein